MLKRLLRRLGIIESCSNCESALVEQPWPDKLTHCVVCGDKEGKITRWVWGRLVDPFCWIGQRTVARNAKLYVLPIEDALKTYNVLVPIIKGLVSYQVDAKSPSKAKEIVASGDGEFNGIYSWTEDHDSNNWEVWDV